MSETVTLTDDQRAWRKSMLEGLDALGAKIEAINGPYRETVDALRALRELSNLAIDDEDVGPCCSCGEPIWSVADDGDFASNDDGDRFCMRCVMEWSAAEVEDAQVSHLPPHVALTDDVPAGADYRELKPNGQQAAYLVLSEEERGKDFVRPVRNSYVHVGRNPILDGPIIVAYGEGGCGGMTKISTEIAETYARDPNFYTGTFCATCGKHLPLDEFVWDGTAERVGS